MKDTFNPNVPDKPQWLIFAVITLTLFFVSLNAQSTQKPTLRFNHLTVEKDGLSSDIVNCIVQDRQGFLWFGTLDGLNKYDGYTMTTYRHWRSDPGSLVSTHITTLYVDRSQTLWIGTGAGLERFDPTIEQFIFYPMFGRDEILAIYEDSTGTFWIGTGGCGLFQYDRATGDIVHYQPDPKNPHSLQDDVITSICEDSSGTLWFGTPKGLYRLDRESEQFARYHHDPGNPHSLSHSWVQAIYEDRLGNLWVGTGQDYEAEIGGLNRFDNTTGGFTHYGHNPEDNNSLSHGHVTAIYEDQIGALWIGTEDGLNILDRTTGKFIRYQHEVLDPYSLSENTIKTIYEDRSGIVWVGTMNGGANAYARHKEKFALYQHDPGDPNSLSGKDVGAIWKDRSGILWIGVPESGLNRLDRSTGEYTHYFPNPDDPYSLGHENVRALYEDHEGVLWVGTNKGLARFDRATKQFINYSHDPDNPYSLGANHVKTILEDHTHTLWVATEEPGTLNKFNRNTGIFIRYQKDPENSNSLRTYGVRALYEDRENILWLGTYHGVYSFDPATEIFTQYRHDPENLHSLSNDYVWSIYEDTKGMLWFGTSGGLNRFDRTTGQFTCYTLEDGLPSDKVYGILADKEDHLWLSTLNGLSLFDPTTEQFTHYGIHDGLQDTEFSIGVYHQSQDGEMFFGGLNGLNAFYPDGISHNPHIPPIMMTDFRIFNTSVPTGIWKDGRSILTKPITETHTLELSYQENVFSFEFAALEYTAPEKNQYAYMMEGFDEDWIYSGTRRFVTYTNLDPGDYVFKVKGSNNDGIWNEDGVSIAIRITPPFWATVWFRVCMIGVLIGGTFGVIYGRIRSIEARNRQLQQQVEERTRELQEAKHLAEDAQRASEIANQAKSTFLTNMSHELRSPLNAILGYAHILKRDKPSDSFDYSGLETIQHSGRHLLNLINDLLDLARIEAQKLELHLSPFHLLECLKAMALMIQIRAQQKEIVFHFEPDPALPMFVSGDEKRLNQVLLNLLSNAVKFTDHGNVTFRVNLVETDRRSVFRDQPVFSDQKGHRPVSTGVRFSIQDTGIGIAPEHIEDIFSAFVQAGDCTSKQKGTGLGLVISQTLVRLMGGELCVESKQGEGSTFWFEIALPTTFESSQQKPVTPDILGYNGGRRTILVVDDNADNRVMLKNLLSPLGFHVIEAVDGQDALNNMTSAPVLSEAGSEAAQFSPDLILLDLVMPTMDGFEVMRHLRQSPKFGQIKTIIVSASTSITGQDILTETGCDDYLPKPIQPDRLLECLRVHLRLEWLYAEPPKPEPADTLPLLFPPKDDLGALVEFAEIGDITGIQDTTARLRHADSRFLPFVAKIDQFAENFHFDQMVAWIKSEE